MATPNISTIEDVLLNILGLVLGDMTGTHQLATSGSGGGQSDPSKSLINEAYRPNAVASGPPWLIAQTSTLSHTGSWAPEYNKDAVTFYKWQQDGWVKRITRVTVWVGLTNRDNAQGQKTNTADPTKTVNASANPVIGLGAAWEYLLGEIPDVAGPGTSFDPNSLESARQVLFGLAGRAGAMSTALQQQIGQVNTKNPEFKGSAESAWYQRVRVADQFLNDIGTQYVRWDAALGSMADASRAFIKALLNAVMVWNKISPALHWQHPYRIIASMFNESKLAYGDPTRTPSGAWDLGTQYADTSSGGSSTYTSTGGSELEEHYSAPTAIWTPPEWVGLSSGFDAFDLNGWVKLDQHLRTTWRNHLVESFAPVLAEAAKLVSAFAFGRDSLYIVDPTPVAPLSPPNGGGGGIPNWADFIPNWANFIPNWNDVVPNWNDVVPNWNDVVPNWNDVVPNWNDVVPNWNDVVPNWDDAVPNWNDVVPNWDKVVPNFDGAVPNFDGAVPNWDNAIPNFDGAVPNWDSAVPNWDDAFSSLSSVPPNEDQAGLGPWDLYPNSSSDGGSVPQFGISLPNGSYGGNGSLGDWANSYPNATGGVGGPGAGIVDPFANNPGVVGGIPGWDSLPGAGASTPGSLGDLTPEQLRQLDSVGLLDNVPLSQEQADFLRRNGLGVPGGANPTLGQLTPEQLGALQEAGLLDDIPLTTQQRANLGLPGKLPDTTGGLTKLPVWQTTPVDTSKFPTKVDGLDVSPLPDRSDTGLVIGDVSQPGTGTHPDIPGLVLGTGGFSSVPGVSGTPGVLGSAGLGMPVGGTGTVGNTAGTGGTGAGVGGVPGSAGSSGLPGGSNAAQGAGGMPFMPGMMGGSGTGNQRERDRERSTWLKEDEEVWGTDPECAPAVIGRQGRGSRVEEDEYPTSGDERIVTQEERRQYRGR
ncbi:hypothetical protein [Micromonospora sp. RTGN7]|uniref:hypothetical protein n=1 Tax=Micromonospora sp. RTGN7 TaxID=3016526 RepID=UPI0029FF3D62|nr:hypothetical protein [Micromonospora sp. RTGN7]